MRMDIADLRLFLAVADAGSITAGAAQANLALGSASERLRAMIEDAADLGVGVRDESGEDFHVAREQASFVSRQG